MLKFAVRNLMSRPLRSLLSLVGLTVAIMGMIGLFSVAGGLERNGGRHVRPHQGAGGDAAGCADSPLFAAAGGLGSGDRPRPRCPHRQPGDLDAGQRHRRQDHHQPSAVPVRGRHLHRGWQLKQGVYRNDIVAGRFLTESDRGTLNTVVSRPIAEEFHKGVGDTLTVNGYDLKIVGIYYCGSLLLDVAIILDINEVRRISRFGSDSVSAFYIEQTGDVSDAVLTRRIQDAFKGREIQPWQPSSSRESLTTGNLLVDLLARLLSQLPLPSAPPEDCRRRSRRIGRKRCRERTDKIRETGGAADRSPQRHRLGSAVPGFQRRPRLVSGHHERDRRDDRRLEHRQHHADERHRADH